MLKAMADIDYHIIFNAVPSLFILLKPDAPAFTILDANAAYLSVAKKELEEITGRGLFDVFPGNPDDATYDSMANLRRSLEKVVVTKLPDDMPLQKYYMKVGSGSEVVFEEKFWRSKNTPVLSADNQIIYIIRQVDDVTASVQAENKRIAAAKITEAELEKKSLLIKQNDTRINLLLSALLKYTTMDFSEKLAITENGDELDAIAFGLNSLVGELENQMQQMQQFNNELEDANNELDSFSYSVSHDLRAPLRAVSGYSQVLLEDYGDKLDEDGKYTINVIIRNAAKMGALIDDLLTFSRVGKQNITKVPLNMSAIINNVINELIDRQQQSRFELIVHELETVNGDNSMMKQVITNLLSNAVKYSGKKEKTIIEVGCHKENGMAVFYVKDNGAGFDMKYYDKLFGVFQRLHSGAEFEGTGVGLALVQRIIKKHGGEVWAESEIDAGATFYFSLPLPIQN